MPVSVSTVAFDGHGMEAGFAMLASLGVTAVEPAFINGYVAFDETAFSAASARRMNRMLAESGLRAQALAAHIDLGLRNAPELLLRRASFAARIGAPILITNATTTARRAQMRRTLDAVLPRIQTLGLTLALENPGHGTGAILYDGPSAAALVAEFTHPALRLNYDIGNALTYGARASDGLADLQAAVPVAAHLHVKDVAEDACGWQFCAVGDGMLGYPALLHWLAKTHPDLPVGLELPLRLHRPGRGDPVRRTDPPALDAIRTALRRSLAVFGHQVRD